jgi:hypothetical protein
MDTKVLEVVRQVCPNYDSLPLENKEIAYRNIEKALRTGSSLPGFERLRRITGYLVGSLERWNDGKIAEESARVKHSI